MPVRCRGLQLYAMEFVRSGLGLLNRDSPVFVDDINLVKVHQECLNQFPHKYEIETTHDLQFKSLTIFRESRYLL